MTPRRYLNGNQWLMLDTVRDAGELGVHPANGGEVNTLRSLARLYLVRWFEGQARLTAAGKMLLDEDRPHKAAR